MVKRKKTKLKWWWIAIPIVIIIITLFSFYNSSNTNDLPQSQESSADYHLYQDSTYNFSIEYPQAWEIRNNTQVFENGDVIAFGISGPTQKENSDITDGAQIAISKPFSISQDLSTWAREYYARYSEFSIQNINGLKYQKVYSCDRSCMTYYYTMINNQIYGIAVFSQGQDKMVYENAIVYMLKSFKFTNLKGEIFTKEQAIAKVKALPEVIDYLKRIPNGLILVNGENSSAYFIQVYEFKDGHTATFNWYNVFKTTGIIEKQF